MGNCGSLPRGTIPSQIGNPSESGGITKYEDFNRPTIQTWILKIHCSCEGCRGNVKKVLRNIDAVHTFNIDPGQQKATVTGTVSADVLLKKLQKKCGKCTELWPVTQNKPKNKTLKTQKEQNPGRHEDNGQVVEDGPIRFPMEALVAATNNFHIDNKIGEGAFGPVYKGTTKDGKQIAVKKLSYTSNQGTQEFTNEKMLAKIQHRNFVNLLGCCAQGSEKFLVYEYLPNKSLDKWLSDPEKRKELDWRKRYTIILGIASGLRYLHEESQLRIVHRDIKSSNILLDEKLIPKIADFGIAKIFPEDRTDVITRIVGTPAYMAPEYLRGEKLSANADVYSFGIVLLELLTGRKISSDPRKLLEWVWSSYKPDNVLRTIDPTIIETCDKEKASRCIQVGLLCTQEDSLRRPPMSEVTAMLSTSLILPVPTNPPGSNVQRRKVKGSNVRRTKVNPVDGGM